MTQEVAREIVRRRVVRITLVSSIGLALVGLLLLLASQPRQAFAKTNSLGVLRQTGTGDALRITGTARMNNMEMEAMGRAMSHLIMALDTLHKMQQQHMMNSAMMGGMMRDMGRTAGTTDTMGTMGMNAVGSRSDVGALIEMMGHMAESIGYMHEAMDYSTMNVTTSTDMGDMMNGAWADFSDMLDILDQMVQATTSQVPTLSGMPGATETGTTTDTMGTGATGATTVTGTVTGMMGMGSMTGGFDPSPMLPAMIQTLQAMSGQLRGMTGATATGATETTTDTADMGTDMMSMGTPSLRQAMQGIGQSLELMGHMQMMMAAMHGVGDPDSTTMETGGDMMGLINELAQAMSDHVSVLTGGDTSGIGVTGTTTDTTGTGTDTSAMTETTGMTDTTGMTGTTDSDSMGMNSANPALRSAAQLIQIALLQIQGMTGGIEGGTAQ